MSHYIIYGKDDCPHTKKARQDFLKQHKSFIYVNVETNAHGLETLLKYTDGKYMVPVIVDVDEEKAEIGYTGD
jgi:glutaredoxin